MSDQMFGGKWFTVYWTNGVKSHVYGPTVSDALKDAGLSDSSEIAWTDEEFTPTHYFDKEKNKWEWYKIARICKEDFLRLSLDNLIKVMETHSTIIVTLQNKDKVTLCLGWACLPVGQNSSVWVNHIEISFDRFQRATYTTHQESDDWEDPETEYRLSSSQFFSPIDLPHALVIFKERVEGELFNKVESPHSTSMEEIYAKQEIKFEE